MSDKTRTEVRATAWEDPVKGNINVAIVREVTDEDGDVEYHIATGGVCVTRRLEYDEEATGDYPAEPLVSLTKQEARVIAQALGAIQAVAFGHDTERMVPRHA